MQVRMFYAYVIYKEEIIQPLITYVFMVFLVRQIKI